MENGSGLSPWALQKDPLWVKRTVAKHTGCHGDLYEDDLAPCLRLKPLNFLLNIKVDTPRFLPGFAPFIDGTILVNPTAPPPSSSSSTVATSAGYELADFPDRDLLFALTSTESYLDLNAQDLEFGFNETKRDRILRTYVRNSYFFHLNEIFSTLKNEYTDWEKPSQNPLSVRDATLDVLSDGHTVAPLIRIGYLHSLSGGKTFFLHFQHHGGERDMPLRGGTVRGDDLPYILGLPLINGGSFFPHNYSHSDIAVSKTMIQYISNFITKGDPNGGAVPNALPTANKPQSQDGNRIPNLPYWDTYDTINQFYLELGSCSTSTGESYDKVFETRQMQYNCNKSPYHTMSRAGSFKREAIPNFIGDYNSDKISMADVQMTELPLQEFNSSPPPAKRPEGNSHALPPDVTTTNNPEQHCSTTSPTIPEPPPPPKGQPPTTGYNQTGILRSHGVPTTPGTMKKRVQIQEISV
ncbi:hypothetical protein GWI33_018473 [Rhynchophorus ferrugineus]|uniref:Carboxylesterase type B domain-containing protein n=1 Tax=Rhynchophorus ferrugineus TaxID=354439 RepID=A0A834HTC9_RHYFE|nr:hypothetical protein GWI33_018473 [Rhynchophorus ferrugineus]